MIKALRPLTLALSLILFASATPAFAQSWTSANGEFTIEAEFVQVKDGKVQLKKQSDGKLIWVDLTKLSSDAQKQAKQLGEKAGGSSNKENKSADGNSLLDQLKVKCTAEIKESKFGGQEPAQVVVAVDAMGPPAAEAMRYGKVQLKKFTDGAGETLTAEKNPYSLTDITKAYEKVERNGFFGEHPKKGVSVKLKLPADVKPEKISELAGTFSIVTGGTKSVESVSNLSDHFGKAVESEALKKAKLKVKFEEPSTENDGYSISFNVSGNLDSLNRVWIGDAKKKELDGQQGHSFSNSGLSEGHSFFFEKDVSKKAVLYIETVEGAVELEIPFDFSDIKVAGK